jgi:hypothetical protein
MSQPSGPSRAQFHQALASVARAIANSPKITEVWNWMAEARRMVVPFDVMGIVHLERRS